jgi:predicted Zn finger-like uncharacterized protein
LRTYAVKASEKVGNLSKEFVRLSEFLEDEDENKSSQDGDEALLSKMERIRGAIHIINTLKSMNDTSLSDWEGVIGDILDRKRQEQEEQVENLIELVEKAEPILKADGNADIIGPENSNAERFSELEALRKDIRMAINQMGSGIIRLPRVQSGLEDVIAQCPACSELVTYSQGRFSKKLRGLKCQHCQTQLVSRYNEEKGNFVLEVRKPVSEAVNCPNCQAQITVDLDPLRSPPMELKCAKCGIPFYARRKNWKMRVGLMSEGLLKVQSGNSEEVNEKIIESVRKEMPAQPWPKSAHKEVAMKLGLSEKTVRSVITHLIKSGVFYPQMEGKVYVPRVEEAK